MGFGENSNKIWIFTFNTVKHHYATDIKLEKMEGFLDFRLQRFK